MIRSMTGFGEASKHVGAAHYFVEVRSLNSKYFKAMIRLPDELQALEAELETILRHKLARVSVFMTAKHADASGGAAYTINQAALASYMQQLSTLPQAGAQTVKIELGALLGLPGVLQPPADEEVRLAHARATLTELITRACDGVLAMRLREGEVVRSDMLTHLDVIGERLKLVSARAPMVMAEYEKRLKARIAGMIKELGVTVEAVDVVREIGIAAERADTSEEISRLTAHIDQFAELLSGPDPRPVGRTLDFLTQEMLREANTIASKCQDAEISRWTVEIKGAIDRIKEQVQNVE